MARVRRALQEEREGYKGPSHDRHKHRRERKRRREQALRDAWVTELWGARGHGACGRKSRFRCRHDAERYVIRTHTSLPMWTYRCPYCGGWHLTRHPEDGCLEIVGR